MITKKSYLYKFIANLDAGGRSSSVGTDVGDFVLASERQTEGHVVWLHSDDCD